MSSIPSYGASEQIVYYYDARYLYKDWTLEENANKAWDEWHALAALQGLINRENPTLYINYCNGFNINTDSFWLDWYQKEDGWLKNAKVVELKSLDEVFNTFSHIPNGLVAYDPKVDATACLASTAAGCLDLIPVRWSENEDSLYKKLSKQWEVKEWLVHPDGSSIFVASEEDTPKTAAYRWAVERYLKSGLCDPLYVGYYIDSYWLKQYRNSGPDMHTLSNQDYFIGKRAFFFDLSPWDDETPNDDRDQKMGADLAMFRHIMHNVYLQNGGRICKVGGFTPWPFKYTDHGAVKCKHNGVDTEWQFGKVISQYNGYMEADAAGLSSMANASFHTHYPLKKRYEQPNRAVIDQRLKEARAKKTVEPGLYIGHYVGDYDSPAWLYKAVPAFFNADGPTLGTVPLGRAFNPNLADRAPMALVYAYKHASTNDFFITGDSGAGYLNPRSLTQRETVDYPSGLDTWCEHCSRYMYQWDMSIVGFILDGAGYGSTDYELRAYNDFSPNGCGVHFVGEFGESSMLGGVPICREWDPDGNPAIAARDMTGIAKRYEPNRPVFAWCRSILKSPQWYKEVADILARDYPDVKVQIVDPYTFFELIRIANQE